MADSPATRLNNMAIEILCLRSGCVWKHPLFLVVWVSRYFPFKDSLDRAERQLSGLEEEDVVEGIAPAMSW